MSRVKSLLRLLVALSTCLPLAGMSWAAHINTSTHPTTKRNTSNKVSETQRTRRRMHHLARSRSATTGARFGYHAAIAIMSAFT